MADAPKPRKFVKKEAETATVSKRKRDQCETKEVKLEKSTLPTKSNTAASTGTLISSAVLTEAKPKAKPEESPCAKRFRVSDAECVSAESLVMKMKRKHQTRLAELAVIIDYRQNKGATVDAFHSFLLSLGSSQPTREATTLCKTENPTGESSVAESSVVERHDDRSHGRYWALIACLLSVQCRDGNHEPCACDGDTHTHIVKTCKKIENQSRSQ